MNHSDIPDKTMVIRQDPLRQNKPVDHSPPTVKEIIEQTNTPSPGPRLGRQVWLAVVMLLGLTFLGALYFTLSAPARVSP